MGQTFPKTARVRHRAGFLAAQKRGRRLHTTHFIVLLYDRRDEDPARLGLVTSRKVAKAVGRNFVRRVLRETFRLHREAFPRGFDVIVIAKAGAAELASEAIRGEVLGVLSRRGGRSPAPRPKEG